MIRTKFNQNIKMRDGNSWTLFDLEHSMIITPINKVKNKQLHNNIKLNKHAIKVD